MANPRTIVIGLLGLVLVSALAVGCGPVEAQSNNNFNSLDRNDDDGDGFSEAGGDCDDGNPAVYPGAPEIMDGIDNNCDGKIDRDLDGDGWATDEGDCNDNDASINPMAGEVCGDGVDNNCNGETDDEESDQDGDGFGPCSTPYRDCNDHEFYISPGSIEDPTDGVDNDCDGAVDEDEGGCDCEAIEPGTTMEEQMARAIGLCNPAIITSMTLSGNPDGYGVFDSWGAIAPRTTTAVDDGLPEVNCQYIILASGATKNTDPQNGADSDLGIYNATDPAPAAGQDGAEINDLTQFILTLRVPPNVTGFSFDFIYFSVEYPEWVCSMFNDTFYALVTGDPALDGGSRTNISFDMQQNEITVNAGFFETPPTWTVDISGTDYEHSDTTMCGLGMGFPNCTPPNPCPQYVGSTTGWLRTTSPSTPGEEIELIFSIHDEGDEVLDSAVVIDNFRWQTVPIDGPGTVK